VDCLPQAYDQYFYKPTFTCKKKSIDSASMDDQISYQELIEAAADIAEKPQNCRFPIFEKSVLIELKENMTPVTIGDKKTRKHSRGISKGVSGLWNSGRRI